MPLTRDQVDTIVGSLVSRANAAISTLEGTKSTFGGITGNNDSIEQSEGALRNVINQIQPNWQSAGYAYADACDAGNETAVDPDANGTDTYGDMINKWQLSGLDFNKAIAEIDGYGIDASLQAVIGQTVAVTATTVKDAGEKIVKEAALLIPWYVYAGAGLLAVGLIFLVIKAGSPKISVGG